ncbi:MAG: hypothetical protein R3E21_07905 [Caenibius sp.]
MAQAKIIPTTAPHTAATNTDVFDIETGEIMTAAEAHRRTLMRRLWAEHDMDGRAR